ncbi:MAG: SoxR reducing system RseC family protein [Azoarcus sp.]|jgi:sigma-E factor negative regulatory protein RseC|nr:SoxR reducing system RseC family protein [Azoarcus sp.]
MIETRAIVVRAGEGKAWIRLLEQHEGCGHCNEPGGCHAPQLAGLFRGNEKTFAINNTLGLHPEERIKIMINDGVPLRAALSSYGLGTALMLGAAALGVWLAPAAKADLAAAAGLILGITLFVTTLAIRTRRHTPNANPLHIERDNAPSAQCANTARNNT